MLQVLTANLMTAPTWLAPYPVGFLMGISLWLGACFGSFSNVLIYRLPRNLSVVGPRSFCPGCEKQVAWFDNIPLVSWVLLGAKCRHCKNPISLRYFLLEVAGALCVLLAVARFGWTLEALAAALFLILMLDIAVIDWQHMIIPHTLTISGMILGLLFALAGTRDFLDSFWGLAVGAGIILAVSWGYKALRGMVGMGGGDVMLMGMVGAFVGPWGALVVLFGGAFLGTIFAVTLGRGRVDGAAKLPFGTFLSAAAVLILFFGDHLFSWYIGRF